MTAGVRRALRAGTGAGTVALLLLSGSGAPAALAGSTNGATHTRPAAATALSVSDESENTVGSWRVSQVDDDRYRLTWVSPTELPLTDARPEFLRDGRSIGIPRLADDGRTLTLAVASAVEPVVDEVDVVLSDEVLDSTVQPNESAAVAPYTAPRDLAPLAFDPGLPGSHAVQSSSYRLPGFAFRGLPAKLEMLGQVVQPTDADAESPLVLFLHGRHSTCYGRATGEQSEWPCPQGQRPIPSHLGYRYAQRLLASQGYVTVSISANGINAQDHRLADGGAAARSTLIQRHLERWVGWAGTSTPRYVADLDRVVLVGHSRGGEGANRASLDVPLSAPYRIVGQVLIGPTDFGRQTTAYQNTVTVLPYCDGDVSDLQGQIFTDAARDLAADDTALHSSALVMGANHNYFNTEWTPGISAAPSWDDWGGDADETCGTDTEQRLSAAEQRDVGRSYIAGAVQLMASDEQRALPMFDGSEVAVASAGGADVRTHLVGAGRDVRRMGIETSLGIRNGAQTRICAGRATYRYSARACGRGTDSSQAPHWTPQYIPGLPATPNLEMSWDTADSWGRVRLTEPLDLSAATSLDLRTIVDPGQGRVRLDVRLRDDAGRRVTIIPESGSLPALPGEFSPLAKRWAQTLRAGLDATGSVDLSRIVAVDLIGRTGDGHIFVLDLAAARAELPDLQNRRAATVSLGDARIQEGDGPGPTTARVPYRVRGAVSPGAEVVVTATDLWSYRSLAPVRIPITGSSGVIRVPLPADTRDDIDVTRWGIEAYPWADIMTRRYVGLVKVLDDDPAPAVELTAARRTTEGEDAVWRVRLSDPVDYFIEMRGTFVEPSGRLPELRFGDLDQRWAREYFGDRRTGLPLHELRRGLYSYIAPGRRTGTFELPVRRDGADEGRETAALKVRVVPGLGTLRQGLVVTDR